MDIDEFVNLLPVIFIVMSLWLIASCNPYKFPEATETIIVQDGNGNIVNKIIQPKRYGRCR